MINSKAQIGLIAGVLFALGIGLTLYKSMVLDLPLVPDQYREVWTIESKTSFAPSRSRGDSSNDSSISGQGNSAVNIELELPAGQAGWVILEEHFASSGFGFSIVNKSAEQGEGSVARWTRQQLDRPTTLYYKMQTYRASENLELPSLPRTLKSKPLLEPDQQAAMDRLLDRLQQQSSDTESFVRLLLQVFIQDSPDQDSLFLLDSYEDDSLTLIMDMLAMAEISAHPIRGILLEDGRRRQTLSSLIEIYNGERWQIFDPTNASAGLPENFFIWQRGDGAVLKVVGGRDSRLEFALVSNSLPAKAVVGMEQRSDQYAILDFSIYSLPVEQQGIFKGLLLIPVAALVVVLMRVLVGVRTSGTFMPILIALAFIQTTLFVGLAIFLGLIGMGLWIRSYLSHLNLLLVARVSTVIIVVILLMAALAVVSYKLGLTQVLTVTFFPTVIVAWTIERMSILWEEEGGHEVLIQGGGSLLVAVLAYLVMSHRQVEHLTFNFPELTLSLLAVILLLGKYTGYRLSELYRFRDMGSR